MLLRSNSGHDKQLQDKQARVVAKFCRSRNAGVMHACGHDAHMAMLLGGARLLKDREAELRGVGTVKIVFQPAEEGGAGAAKMLSEGAHSVASLLWRCWKSCTMPRYTE